MSEVTELSWCPASLKPLRFSLRVFLAEVKGGNFHPETQVLTPEQPPQAGSRQGQRRDAADSGVDQLHHLVNWQ